METNSRQVSDDEALYAFIEQTSPTWTHFAQTAEAGAVNNELVDLAVVGEMTQVDPIILTAILNLNKKRIERELTVRGKTRTYCDYEGLVFLDRTVATPAQKTVGEMGDTLCMGASEIVHALREARLLGAGVPRYSRRAMPLTHPGPLHYDAVHFEAIRKGTTLPAINLEQDIPLNEIAPGADPRTVRELLELHDLAPYLRRLDLQSLHTIRCVPRAQASVIQQLFATIEPFRSDLSCVPHTRIQRVLEHRGIHLSSAAILREARGLGGATLYRLPNQSLIVGLNATQQDALLTKYIPELRQLPATVSEQPAKPASLRPSPSMPVVRRSNGKSLQPSAPAPRPIRQRLTPEGTGAQTAFRPTAAELAALAVRQPDIPLPGRYHPANMSLPRLGAKGKLEDIPRLPALSNLADRYGLPLQILIAVARQHVATRNELIGIDDKGVVVASRNVHRILASLAATRQLHNIPATWCVLDDVAHAANMPTTKTELAAQFGDHHFRKIKYKTTRDAGIPEREIVFCSPLVAVRMLSQASNRRA